MVECQETVYRHLPVSLFLEASKKEKQTQALEHAVNYLVASAGVLMNGSTRTLSVWSASKTLGLQVQSSEALLFLTP